MKAKNTLPGLGITLLLCAALLHAETSPDTAIEKKPETVLTKIEKERETVLTKIVELHEQRKSLGTVDIEELFAAKHALYSFRRDTASTIAEKLEHQAQIVTLQSELLSMLKVFSQRGVIDQLDILRATDALLAARQLLAEMQLEEKRG